MIMDTVVAPSWEGMLSIQTPGDSKPIPAAALATLFRLEAKQNIRGKLVSTNRRRTIVRPLCECRRRVAGRLATMVSWTVFDNETTVHGNHRGAIVVWKCRGCILDGVVAPSWACCWSPCDDGFVDGFWPQNDGSWKSSWHYHGVEASWMMSWHRRGRVASCPATAVLWKPSWSP